VEDSIIALGFSKDKDNLKKCLPHLNRIARRAKKIRIMGSAALELAYVASGRLDAYVERTHQSVGRGRRFAAGGECRRRIFTPARAGQYRYAMCADNGKLRKKLQVGGLLK
jgi:myo-inositol-1(or 4)-monophosphatase